MRAKKQTLCQPIRMTDASTGAESIRTLASVYFRLGDRTPSPSESRRCAGEPRPLGARRIRHFFCFRKNSLPCCASERIFCQSIFNVSILSHASFNFVERGRYLVSISLGKLLKIWGKMGDLSTSLPSQFGPESAWDSVHPNEKESNTRTESNA